MKEGDYVEVLGNGGSTGKRRHVSGDGFNHISPKGVPSLNRNSLVLSRIKCQVLQKSQCY